MNAEKLVVKGVRRHFDGKKVFFDVESLNEHYNDLLIHDSDIVDIEDVAYVSVEDVNFEHATENEVAREEEVPYELSEEGTVGIVSTLTPEEADVLIKEMNEEIPANEIDVVVTQETLDMNPELAEEGIVVGETITIDAAEEIPAKEDTIVWYGSTFPEEKISTEEVEEVVAPVKTYAQSKKKRK